MDAVLFEAASITRYPNIGAWQAEASDLVATMLDRWRLEPGGAYIGGVSGSVLAVTRDDGSPAVLKVSYPHVESVWEAVGLQAMGTGLAPALLEQDAWTWSMLLEPITPGTPLSRAPIPASSALAIGAEVMMRVHETSVPTGCPTLGDGMATYARDARARVPGQHHELHLLGVVDLVSDAVETLERLGADEVDPRLLHGDFNPGNVLEGASSWLTVDPNPLVGDPAYDLWPLVSQLGHPAESHDLSALLGSQFETVANITGLDAARAALWGFARAGLDVSWYLQDGEGDQARIAVRQLRAWAAVCGR